MGRKICNFFEGIFYRENFKGSPFKKVIELLFGVKIKYEEEGKDLMLDVILLCMK